MSGTTVGIIAVSIAVALIALNLWIVVRDAAKIFNQEKEEMSQIPITKVKLLDNDGNVATVEVAQPNNFQLEIKVEGYQTICIDLFKHDRPILIIDGTDQDTTEHMIQLKNLDPE